MTQTEPQPNSRKGPLSHPAVVDGWFTERNDTAFPGQGFSLRVRQILYTAKSKFQDILIFESTDFGNVLVLDGIIQCTERDEFAYQEMIAHIPLFAHPNPKNVLIVGGGDGGVLREVVKHNCLDLITLVEIDENVINLSKKYLPHMATCLIDQSDPRIQVKICDGFQFLHDLANGSEKYDIIITDSSDPEGPAESFFQIDYFKLLFNALNDNGIVIAQTSENIWLDINYLHNLNIIAKMVFPKVENCYTMVPSYTSGQLGLLVCSKDPTTDLKVPIRKPSNTDKFNYYNTDIHSASFVLPNWANNILNSTKK